MKKGLVCGSKNEDRRPRQPPVKNEVKDGLCKSVHIIPNDVIYVVVGTKTPPGGGDKIRLFLGGFKSVFLGETVDKIDDNDGDVFIKDAGYEDADSQSYSDQNEHNDEGDPIKLHSFRFSFGSRLDLD